ncbi:MAG: ribulose-phosphate 3-epimerase [Planctomycetaceae bacterium]|nr:ribulose-phosphate 3-epimerase [Planctomycetaceae bacterium]
MMTRQDVLEKLSQRGPTIAPSMLKCDFGCLNAEVEALKSAGAHLLHWDVMDGHFVPNLSYGAPVIAAIRETTDLIFDAHLMISEPERYLEDFLKAGCDCLTVHYEAVPDSESLLKEIRSANRVAGLAINPGTPVEAIASVLPECDLVLVMSVEPGFGGQKFKPMALEKLQELKKRCSPSTILSVDGGIGPDTITQTAEAGASLFVVGSAIFDEDNYQSALDQLAGKARLGLPQT